MTASDKKTELSELDMSTLLAAIDRLQSGFAIHDKDFGLIYANRATRSYWPDLYEGLEDGLSQEEAVAKEVKAQFPDVPATKQAELTKYSVEAQNSGEGYEIATRDGRIFRTHHEPIGDKGFVGIAIDLTDIKAYQAELKKLAEENHKLANKDELTGLSNRRHFCSSLDNLIEKSTETDAAFSLGMLDLDGFKIVNDIFGHPFGDELLISVANRVTEVLGDDAFVARLGGDEFGFVVRGKLSRNDLEKIGENLCSKLSEPYHIGPDIISIAASVGFAMYPSAGSSRTLLFEKADFALCHAKQNGKNQALIFSTEHELRIRRRSSIEMKLRDASIAEELSIDFQPILSASNQRVVGFEALARWQNSQLGSVPPSEFIPLAEQTGQILPLTLTLLKKALQVAKNFPDDVFLSFNLSAAEVSSISHAQNLLDIIKRSGFQPNRLVFEITETATSRDTTKVFRVLKMFRKEGIRVALDDFGSGYSSLNLIAHMPLDMIKIDRSFISDIGRPEATDAVLKSICDLSRNLALTTVIEGIETDAQHVAAGLSGVEMMQGYLFSRPIKAADIAEIMRQDQAAERTSENFLNGTTGNDAPVYSIG